MKMVFLWGILLLWLHSVQGRHPRRNQANAPLDEKMVNDLQQALDTAKQTINKTTKADLADNSFVSASSGSTFVGLMYWLQRNEKYPMEKFLLPSGGLSEPWLRAIYGIIPAPLMLLVLGIGVTIYVLRVSTRSGKTALTDVESRCLSKPSLTSLSCFTIGLSAVILFIALTATGSAANTAFTVLGVFRDIEPDLRYIEESLDVIEPEIHNADLWLGGWIESCPDFITKSAQTISPDAYKKFESLNDEYVNLLKGQTMTIYNVSQQIKAIPRYVEKAHCVIKSFLRVGNLEPCKELHFWINPLGLYGLFLLVLPTFIVLVAICCCIRSAIRHEEDSMLHKAGDSGTDYGVIGLACCNLCIVLLAVFLLTLLLSLGVFCENTEINTVSLASASKNGNATSLETQSISYYLTGTPPENLIVENMRKARIVLEQLGHGLWLIKGLLDAVGVMCSHIGYVDPSALLDKAVPRVNQIIPMAKRDRVYYYFDSLANKAVCRNVFNSLTLTLISQLAICLFLIPVVSKRLHAYIKDMKAYQLQLKAANDAERKSLIQYGYYCEDCRREWKKPKPGSSATASLLPWSTMGTIPQGDDFATQTQNYEKSAATRYCPECGGKLRRGARELNLPKADNGACSVQ